VVHSGLASARRTICFCTIPLQSYGSQTVWDRLLYTPEDAKLALKGEPVEYPLLLGGDSGKLRGANVSLSLRWDIMPLAGGLKLGSAVGGAAGASSAAGVDSTPFDHHVATAARQAVATALAPALAERAGSTGMSGVGLGVPMVATNPGAGCGAECGELDAVRLPLQECKGKRRCKWRRLGPGLGGGADGGDVGGGRGGGAIEDEDKGLGGAGARESKLKMKKSRKGSAGREEEL